MANPYTWFRVYNDARTDNKLRTLTDAQHRVWFDLLCLASEQHEARGTVPCGNPRVLALEVAHGDVELLDATIAQLVDLDIVTRDDDGITFVHWNERQYDRPSDRPDRVRERVQRHREHKTEPDGNDLKRDVTPCNAVKRDVTRGNAQRIEEESIEEKSRGEDKRLDVFGPPASGGKQKSAEKPNRRRQLPEGLPYSEEYREAAAKVRPDLDPARAAAEFEQFTDFHRGKGTVFADPVSGWRTWLRRVGQYGGAVRPEPPKPKRDDPWALYVEATTRKISEYQAALDNPGERFKGREPQIRAAMEALQAQFAEAAARHDGQTGAVQ